MSKVLLVVDIQKEYTVAGRRFYIPGIEESLNNCQDILQHARGSDDWHVVHAQHIRTQGGDIFSPGSEHIDFIDGFHPIEEEKVFVKQDFSCFSCAGLARHLEALHHQDHSIFMIGYNTCCCINSTLEDAHLRGIKLNWIKDCSLSIPTADYSGKDIHNTLASVWSTKGIAHVINKTNVIS